MVLTPSSEGTKTPEIQISKFPQTITREAFRQAYGDAGSPRLAVFWDRTFNDCLREVEVGGRFVVEQVRDDDEAQSLPETYVFELQPVCSSERASWSESPYSEIAMFRFQSGFLDPLIGAGAKVIDRAAVMRLTEALHLSADSADDVTDRQLVETMALMGHADLLIQIALSPSDESPSGAFFHVSIIEVESGRIRADFFSEMTSEGRQEETWTAVRGGYIRVAQEPDFDLEHMGRALALRTMDALTQL